MISAQRILDGLERSDEGFITSTGEVVYPTPEVKSLTAHIKKKLRDSIKFKLDQEFPTMSNEEMMEAIKEIKLPYPCCFFDLADTGVSVLCEQVSDENIWYQSFFTRGERATALDPRWECSIDLEDGGIVSHTGVKEYSERWAAGKLNDVEKMMLVAAPSFMVRGLQVLNCSNVVQIINKPSKVKNQIRRSRGLTPLFDYYTIEIDTKRKVYDTDGEVISTGHTKRLHLRRGHIRKLSDGRRIWVQPCMAGDPLKGMVTKDYAVI